MTHEEIKLKRLRSERIARTKRLLRWMPRRTNVHRYPVLRWFAGAARRRHYLWSFRVKVAVPALYAGSVLAFLPIYGVQVPLAVLLAFVLRANLPILVTLQLVTNPLTVLPIYYVAYHIGRLFLMLFGVESPHLNLGEVNALIESARAGAWGSNLLFFLKVWSLTSLGGIIIGTFLGTVMSLAYRFGAREVTLTYERLKELQHRREAERAKEEAAAASKPEPPHPSADEKG